MGFSRIFSISCATSTIVAVGIGAATFRSEPADAARGRHSAPQVFSAATRGHVLISGHSLTDRPYPDHLAGIARQTGITMSWKMQTASGSSIKQRAGGKLARLSERPYDLLIITEQHRLLDSLADDDTVRYLRAFHDGFMAANPAAITYFYAPWISIADRTDPGEWIDYERQALPVWRCVVDRVNGDIAETGRSDRIRFIPTSLALAELVARLMADPGFSGFEAWSDADRLNAIFADAVHLTDLGSYYVAAVSFAAVYGRDIKDLQPPSSLDPLQADTVRAFAADFMQSYRAAASHDTGDCGAPVSMAFLSQYAAYTGQAYHLEDKGYLRAELRRIKDILRFAWLFRNGLG